MKRITILLAVVLGCTAVVSANAQSTTAGAIQQQQNLQNSTAQRQALVAIKAGTNAPEMYEGEDSDVGPQHILKTVPRRTYFQVKADSEFLYTDNVFLFPSTSPFLFFRSRPGTIFINTLSVSLAPEAYRLGNGRFAPTVGLQNQWFNYSLGGPNNFSFNDFDVETAYVGGRYLIGDWTLYGQFEYNRFVNQANYYDDFYHDFVPIVGAQHSVKLSKDVLFTVGTRADYHYSWAFPAVTFFTPNPPTGQEDRADLAFDATLNYLATSRLVLQPYYRFQYSYYRYDTASTLHGRNDELHSFGLSAAYYFTQSLSLRTFFNQDIRTSDDPFAKMHGYSLGADLTYTLRF